MRDFPIWAWAWFAAGLLTLLALDLFVHRGKRSDSRKTALVWSAIWISAGLGFAGFVWVEFGARQAHEYFAAYLIEKSLSLDNLFVFMVIFQSLEIRKENQRTALSWGIFGALLLRALFIFAGVAAVNRWQWIEYLFGAILLAAAWESYRKDPSQSQDNRFVQWLSRRLPIDPKASGGEFIVGAPGKRCATPLLVAVIALEISDVLFAFDSIPAAFSVSREPFILYSSNVFAILGLRSLYLVLAQMIGGFRYLHFGLAAVLAFAGLKLITDRWFEIGPLTSVGVIVACVGIAVIASIILRRRSPHR